MKHARFAPSLMCIDLMSPISELSYLDTVVSQYHLDIMDGHFAPNFALSFDWVKALNSSVRKPIELHMMTEDPARWLPDFIECGARIVSLHLETINGNAFRLFNALGEADIQAGVVLNPATPVAMVEPLVDRVSLVTLMTVDVGFAGQPFIPEVLSKIEQLVALREKRGLDFCVQIDGSCNARTFKQLRCAGAELFILGNSGLFKFEGTIEEKWAKAMDAYVSATGESVHV